ncbi:MAG: ABC transporter ATP-binding protein [Acidimicrobiia bacterium]|nr:ABC transporter ATP-binding protein [Acidimicrobiia bacterium]
MSSKIIASGLYKVYETQTGDDVVALENVNLTIGTNEFVTLVGPSGCGKSTFLKMIASLIEPSHGTLSLDGTPLDGPSRDVGIVFQDATLLPWRNVLDNVLLPVEILSLPKEDYRPRAMDLLRLVGLTGFEHRMPNELSGGMQQRTAICRALIHNPSILLMDEPFAALDAMTREELGLELMRIWEEEKKTIVFVTHSIPEAILLADRVVVMTPRPGKIAHVIEVDLPRPRTLAMEFSEKFKSYSDDVRALIYAGRHEEPSPRST